MNILIVSFLKIKMKGLVFVNEVGIYLSFDLRMVYVSQLYVVKMFLNEFLVYEVLYVFNVTGNYFLNYIKNCVKLTDGSIGLIEETTSAYNETEEFIAEIYYFLPTKRTTKLDMDICEGLKIDKTENFVCSWGNMIETGFMTPEEEVRFQYLKPDTEFEMMEILALCMADVNYPELVDENILFSVYPFTREDVFRYLINISMSEENACYWTEVIRKGQFADKYEKGNNKNEADYFDDSEVEMFKAVKYLPSEILVLTTYELYKRCAVQNKITQIRDLERQKEWFGYRGN